MSVESICRSILLLNKDNFYFYSLELSRKREIFISKENSLIINKLNIFLLNKIKGEKENGR